MTQKELLYLEDAINHEENLIKYLEDSVSKLDNENIISFFKDEIKTHENICKKQIEEMRGLSNE